MRAVASASSLAAASSFFCCSESDCDSASDFSAFTSWDVACTTQDMIWQCIGRSVNRSWIVDRSINQSINHKAGDAPYISLKEINRITYSTLYDLFPTYTNKLTVSWATNTGAYFTSNENTLLKCSWLSVIKICTFQSCLDTWSYSRWVRFAQGACLLIGSDQLPGPLLLGIYVSFDECL